MGRCYTNSKITCLTVGSKQWLRQKKRLLLGKEKFRLLGINVDNCRIRAAMSSTPEKVLSKLAGNAVSFHNFSQGFLAACCTLPLSCFVRQPNART